MLIQTLKFAKFKQQKVIKLNFAIKKFMLPDLGEKIKDATIAKWLVKEGDTVSEFDPLCEVFTDKLNTEIPAEFSGKIHKLMYEEDEQCAVGACLLEIDAYLGAEEKIDSSQSNDSQNQMQQTIEVDKKDSQKEQPVDTKNFKFLATPVVRNMIKINNIQPWLIQGTGKDGRILKQDVENYLNKDITKQQKPQQQQQSQQPQTIQQQQQKQQNFQSSFTSKIIKMNNFQQGMQKTMTESNKIPTLYLNEEYDITSLSQFRQQLKKTLPLTYMTFLIKSFSLALLKYPILNSSYDPESPYEYKQNQSHNITIAMDSTNGLVVPNIKNVQNLSLGEVQEELNRLRELSQNGKLGSKDLMDGSISLSNIGTIGGTYTSPLILPPQTCIVGIGKMQKLPRFNSQNQVVPRDILNVSFGADHRVIDGATVARFSSEWKGYLENPEKMLLNMK